MTPDNPTERPKNSEILCKMLETTVLDAAEMYPNGTPDVPIGGLIGDTILLPPTILDCSKTVEFTLISHCGPGFAGPESVEPGTTLGEFLKGKHGDLRCEAHITVNGKVASRDHVLASGDQVIIVPTRVQGA